MSVLLNGIDQQVRGAQTPVSSYPVTMNIWYKSASTFTQGMFSYDADTVANAYLLMELRNDENNARHRFTQQGTAASPGNVTQDSWEMMTAVFAAPDDLRVYRNGGNQGISASTAGTPAFGLLTHLRVGVLSTSIVSNYFSGLLAEAAIWSAAFSAGEVSSLYGGGTGLPATSIQPAQVRFYATYESSFTSQVGGSLAPVNGAAISPDHPPISSTPPAAGVSWDQFTPANLRRCWHDGQGNLKPSCTSALYTGGNPTSPNQLKASIVDSNNNIRKAMTNFANNDFNAQMKPPA